MGTSRENIRQRLQAMNKIAVDVETTDLGQLAKMHEYAQQIQQHIDTLPEQAGKVLSVLCANVANANEDIILEDVADPEACLNAVRHTCEELVQIGFEDDADIDTARIQRILNELNTAVEKAKVATHKEGEADTAPADGNPADTPAPSAHIEFESVHYTREPLLISDQEFEYVQSFLTECQEHIENVESLLLAIEQTPDDLNQLNELFRPFHTIKGMAGFLNLKDVNAVTHQAETLLDLARKGKIRLNPAMIDVIFETVDVVKAQVQAIRDYVASPTGQAIPQPPIEALLVRIHDAAIGKLMPKSTERANGTEPLGEILVRDTGTTPELVEFALEKQKAGSEKPVGELLRDMGAVNARDVDQALRKQKAAVQETVIRVDTLKLDNLINMVGELVIAQAQVEQNDVTRTSSRLNTLVEQAAKITRDIQEIAMSLRMVPIASTFQKMGRVARDISHKNGKTIDFVLEGEETELDKNVIQEISDPLMHMVRNAVDHGLETPEERAKTNKPAKGLVKLNAYHQGGNIVIEVQDDGKGLDKDRLLKKAIEKGIVDPNAQLTEQQIFQLILAPGFSTAEKVTDISGRGVGMDVVKRNIENLRGKLDIHSVKGKGTTFVIRLPLTLAVIDGMVVRAGTQKFILPTLLIHQALVPERQQVNSVQGRGKLLNLRGQLYTLVSLGGIFGIDDAATDPTEGMVVIVQTESGRMGIILDELVGQQQVVIKSLGESFRHVQGISGGAILGDGTIGLILEPTGLLERYQQAHPKHSAA